MHQTTKRSADSSMHNGGTREAKAQETTLTTEDGGAIQAIYATRDNGWVARVKENKKRSTALVIHIGWMAVHSILGAEPAVQAVRHVTRSTITHTRFAREAERS